MTPSMWQSLGRDNRGTFREVETGCLCGAFPVLSTHYTLETAKEFDLRRHTPFHRTGLQSSWEMGLQTPNPRVAQPGAVTWRKPLTTSGSPLSILVTGTRSF